MAKNRSINDAPAAVFIESSSVKSVEEENFEYAILNNALVEIKKTPGIVGYILKSSTSATIDLSDPNKLVEYSLLTSKILDSSQAVTRLFDIGKVESITVEGNAVKALFIIKGENRVSLFMEKTVDCAEVLKKIENKLSSH